MKIQVLPSLSLRPLAVFSVAVSLSCQAPKQAEEMVDQSVRIVTVDPGHFHAALVQKSMYDGTIP
jgi:hypothetical protein